jgi:serine/threonine protein kinase
MISDPGVGRSRHDVSICSRSRGKGRENLFICNRCYDDPVVSCTEEGHPSLSQVRDGSRNVIAGYRLESLIGSGIKGQTFRARQIAADQPCLIKILAANVPNKEQFLREAGLAVSLFSPNVVDIYEAGSLESGEVFRRERGSSRPDVARTVEQFWCPSTFNHRSAHVAGSRSSSRHPCSGIDTSCRLS